MRLQTAFPWVSLAMGVAVASWSGCDDGGLIIQGCEGEPPLCVVSCSPDIEAHASPSCIDGQWVCDETTKEEACSCDGNTQLLACDVCELGHIQCSPSNACAAGCGTICQTCEMSAQTEVIDGCTCSCNGGFYTCTEACCGVDADCAVLADGYCAQGVCKTPLEVGCWRDADCGPGGVCQGASICACGADCFTADMPGVCLPP